MSQFFKRIAVEPHRVSARVDIKNEVVGVEFEFHDLTIMLDDAVELDEIVKESGDDEGDQSADDTEILVGDVSQSKMEQAQKKES